MSSVDRTSVAILQVATNSAIDQLPAPHRSIARLLSERIFSLVLSLIDRIEKLEKEKRQ